MPWRIEKTKIGQDLVWDGVEYGIAPSPTKGNANLQNVNIATESGEVMASYGRVAQQQTALSSQTLTPDGATNFTGPDTLKAGTWISVSASTVSSISTSSVPTTVSINYLAVGGGGGSGGVNGYASGGGGGGEVATGSDTLAVGSYAVTVGAGGAGSGPGTNGANGGSSIIDTVVTAVGGGGGGDGNSVINGSSGASGGGGGASNSIAGTGGAATAGNVGGAGNTTSTEEAGGGGGGAGAVGGAASTSDGGTGGNGTASSITGTSVTYGGGGGGGRVGGSGGFGGTGGGGNANLNGAGKGSVGKANTGGGAGGSGGAGVYPGVAGGSGIVVISYPFGSAIAVGGTVSIIGGNVIHTFTESATFRVISIPKTNQYYVSYKSGTTFKLSSKFDPTGANALTHGTTGSVTFSTVTVPNQGIAKAVEKYTTASAVEYRYYILDANSYVWMYDTAIFDTYGTTWMLPDPTDYSGFVLTGLGILSGLVVAVGKAFVLGKPVVDQGRVFTVFPDTYLNEPFPTHKNFAMVGTQGKMYYCDGNYIGEIFPTTSLVTSVANVQSLCSYTATTTTGTISAVVNGSVPYSPSGARIPAVFFTDVYGTQPTNLGQGTLYYIEYDGSASTFQVFSAATGGSAIDIASGEVGNQFFTTFWPFATETGPEGDTPLLQVSTQRVNLPANEVAQYMVEVGNTVLIGGVTNSLYPWNQIDALPSDVIALPEANVKTMVNVNNLAYVFAGNKGNIYVCNLSVASLALKVPDYTAGVPGTPLTYIEPVFYWGDADYMRGRVYFSILDQTATKAGNCGGVWSFVPSQNVDPTQEVGIALRLENQNSYGDYDGYAPILISAIEQDAIAPQYWAAWQDSYSAGTSAFGIDYTNTVPVTTYTFETDLTPTGTLLDKTTFQQLEYKLTTPLASGDSIQLYYRLNATDAWTSCGTVIEELTNRLSGYFKVNFQKTQWTQVRGIVTTNGTTTSSFGRLKELRLR